MAEHRHKRDTDARRKPRAATVAAPLAVLATASAVTLGVLGSNPVTGTLLAQDSAAVSQAGGRHASKQMERPLELMQDRKIASRSESRLARTTALEDADTRLWTTSDLNLWTSSGKLAKQDGEVEAGKRVLVTGRKVAGLSLIHI